MPKVSILSPTYNHEKYIREAIQSIFNQTFQDFEVIIADDASNDSTVEKILNFRDPRLTLLRNDSNQGTTATSTRCWQQCSGEYVIALSTDDIYEPQMLGTLVDYLDQHPKALAVFGLANFIDDNGKVLSESWTDIGVGQDRFTHLRQLFRLQHPFCSVAGMFRRTTFNKFGYFPSYLRQTDDMALYIKILFHGEMPILPDKLLLYRWQANHGNVSARTPENDSRLDFELFEILDLFRENLSSCDLLCKIFPEVSNHPWPLNEKLIAFHLAHIAISFDYTAHRFYGMHLLYQLLKDAINAKYIKELCNFNYIDFFKLTGQEALIMNSESRNSVNCLQSENVSLRNTIQAMQNEIHSQKIPPLLFNMVRKVKNRLRFIKSRLNT